MMDWAKGAARRADQRLQEALEAVEAGTPLEDVIAALPERDRAEIAGLLRLAMVLRAMPHPEPSAASLAHDINRLVAEAKAAPVAPFTDHPARREPLTVRRLLREVYLVGFAMLMLAIFFCALSGNRPRLTELGRPRIAPTLTPTTTPTATLEDVLPSPTPVGEPVFRLASETPLVTYGGPRTWNERYVTPAGALYVDGTFHLFVNGFGVWPGPVSIAHFTSADGLTWTMQGDAPVFGSADVPEVVTLLASDVQVQPDGLWVMGLTIYQPDGSPTRTTVGMATAPGPDGPWTLAGDAILRPGSREWMWDGLQVRTPSLFYTGDALMLFYTGMDNYHRQRIGLAQSVGAQPLAKYDVASTVISELSESDPVLVAGDPGDWDDGQVMQPSVVPYGEGLLMLYRGNQADRTRSDLGLALSGGDGTWTRYPGNPVRIADLLPGARQTYEAELLVVDDTIYVFFAADSGDLHTEIFLAMREGLLP